MKKLTDEGFPGTHLERATVPVRLFGIKESVGARSGAAGNVASPLVGRDSEFASLMGRISRLLTGQGSIVAVIGEAGIGKSRLVAEVKHAVVSERLHWLVGREGLGPASPGSLEGGQG